MYLHIFLCVCVYIYIYYVYNLYDATGRFFWLPVGLEQMLGVQICAPRSLEPFGTHISLGICLSFTMFHLHIMLHTLDPSNYHYHM